MSQLIYLLSNPGRWVLQSSSCYRGGNQGRERHECLEAVVPARERRTCCEFRLLSPEGVRRELRTAYAALSAPASPRPAPAHALITITSCCLSQRSLRQAVPAWDAGDTAEASPARILPTQTHSSLELGALHIAEVPQGNGTGGLGKPGHQGGDRKEHSRRNARGSPRHTLLGSGPAPPRLFSLRAGSEGRPGKWGLDSLDSSLGAEMKCASSRPPSSNLLWTVLLVLSPSTGQRGGATRWRAPGPLDGCLKSHTLICGPHKRKTNFGSV